MFIETIEPEAAIGEVAEIYERDGIDKGYVTNYTRVFADQPAVYDAWSPAQPERSTLHGTATLRIRHTRRGAHPEVELLQPGPRQGVPRRGPGH